MLWFCLTSAHDPTLALQAAAHSGQPLTIQRLDRANPLQHWQLQLHSASQVWSVAFVNPATSLAVSYRGNLQTLLMRPYEPHESGHDGWYVTATPVPHIFRIALAANTHIVWAAVDGSCQPGATLQSCDVATAGDSALWSMYRLSERA